MRRRQLGRRRVVIGVIAVGDVIGEELSDVVRVIRNHAEDVVTVEPSEQRHGPSDHPSSDPVITPT
jgi:hypothetical protein